MDWNSPATCATEVSQLKPLHWRVTAEQTKVISGLFHATPVPAGTGTNNVASPTSADKKRFCHPLKVIAILCDRHETI